MHACASPRIIRYEAQNAVSSLQAADVQVQKHCSVTCLHSASIHLFHLYVRIWYHACMVATSFRRPHRPRDENIRAIFKYAGLNLPGCFLNFAYLKFSSKHDGNMQEMMRMKVVTLTLGHLLVVIRRQEPCILLMQFYLVCYLLAGWCWWCQYGAWWCWWCQYGSCCSSGPKGGSLNRSGPIQQPSEFRLYTCNMHLPNMFKVNLVHACIGGTLVTPPPRVCDGALVLSWCVYF